MALVCTDVGSEIARSRSEFKKKVKRAGFVRSGGRCEMVLPDGSRCNHKLQVGKFTYDHRVPDRLGGEPTLENLQVICQPCDKAKYKTDRKAIDHTRHVEDRHIGAHSPKRPLVSRGFAKAEARRGATKPLEKRLPPRARPLIAPRAQ